MRTFQEKKDLIETLGFSIESQDSMPGQPIKWLLIDKVEHNYTSLYPNNDSEDNAIDVAINTLESSRLIASMGIYNEAVGVNLDIWLQTIIKDHVEPGVYMYRSIARLVDSTYMILNQLHMVLEEAVPEPDDIEFHHDQMMMSFKWSSHYNITIEFRTGNAVAIDNHVSDASQRINIKNDKATLHYVANRLSFIADNETQ
jgi:hypothetical protein